MCSSTLGTVKRGSKHVHSRSALEPMCPGCETSREGKQAVATPHDIAIPSGCVTCRCCTGTVCQRRSRQWPSLVRVTHLAWEWQHSCPGQDGTLPSMQSHMQTMRATI